MHVGAALLLPVAALGAERLAARRAVLGALALIPLAIGVPGNIDLLADPNPAFTGGRNAVLAMAHSPYIDDVPPDTMPMQIDIGHGARVKVVKRIVRCAATNVEPDTGIRDLAIPRTLMQAFGHADCGVYAQVVSGGEVKVGDELRA